MPLEKACERVWKLGEACDSTQHSSKHTTSSRELELIREGEGELGSGPSNQWGMHRLGSVRESLRMGTGLIKVGVGCKWCTNLCKVMVIYTTIVKKHTIILPVVNYGYHGNHCGRLYTSPRVNGHRYITLYSTAIT